IKEYSITAGAFKGMIETLFLYGFRFCNINNFVKGKDKSKILVTFDDAYNGVNEKLFGFLREKEIPFIVVQTCDLLDSEGYLSTDMIREMLQYDKFILETHTQLIFS
ncbi:MAG: hypothetical protein K2K70_03370, partial [Lachnospiraceae bacterium]|nr:hypothetical protein [Lachnospiraceae bacterium]